MSVFYNILLYVCFLILCINCKTTSSTATTLKNENIKNETYIVTYIISIEKKKDDIGNIYYECTLDNQIKAKGYLKQNTGFGHVEEEHNQLVFIFKDGNGQIIYETQQHNPLIKHFDVPHENGTMEKKTVYVNKETIGVRMNYVPSVSLLQIFMLEENQKTEISTIQLAKK